MWAFELCPPCLVRNPLLWAWPACGIKAFGQHQRELITRGLPLLARWKPPTYNCVLFFKKWVILAELSLLTSLGAFEGIRVLGPASGIGTLSLQTSICCRQKLCFEKQRMPQNWVVVAILNPLYFPSAASRSASLQETISVSYCLVLCIPLICSALQKW